jgi:DNA ligase 1
MHRTAFERTSHVAARAALCVVATLALAWWPSVSTASSANAENVATSGAPEPVRPALLLANLWRAELDPSAYLVSEKFDGVRALWDGKVLRFRSGREVAAPSWFLAKLPAEKLDGELWLGRDRFEELSGIARKGVPDDGEWQTIRYMIFELPEAEGTFAQRTVRVRQIVAAANWPQLVAVEQKRFASHALLQRELKRVVLEGGEGLMLHLADAPYVTGRSDVLLKLKPQDDAEARVVAHIPGKGKFVGMLGALRVERADGKRFTIGTGFTDASRRHPPPIGATVTYTHRGLTNTGLPRFASFLRVRNDP